MPIASFLGQDEVTFQRSSQDATASRSCDSVYVQKSMPSHRIVQTTATHQFRCQCIPNSFEKKPCRSYCDQKSDFYGKIDQKSIKQPQIAVKRCKMTKHRYFAVIPNIPLSNFV
ncbi:hypothetical protein B9Z55_021848 [Caenorhabditis nigoni]|uniref:Uncharacterized protein n=1 Tax=Caenorhabditis nigoni TaxID=1611254 RepID=A0A2G5TUB9_9PELO|nr:hypothetical protein B9Z55_021848 [Caenorhabditis nigoni]